MHQLQNILQVIRQLYPLLPRGEKDLHFVPPKPSYAVVLSQADMWITAGLDLDMWSATLIDKPYEGGKLIDLPGCWLKKAMSFRGKRIIS